MKKINNYQGFTLIEIMIALVISSFIMAAIYITFSSQEKTQINQQEITDIQQNIRSAMFVMANEIRLAGYQRDINRDSTIGIQEAGQGKIHITMDLTGGEDDGVDNDGDGLVDEDDTDEDQCGDGIIDDPNEDVTFAFKADDDADGDGIVDDGGIADLCRETRGIDADGNPTTSGLQPMAEGIQAIRFTYIDGNGNNADTDGDGVVDIALSQIRSIRIAILGRSKTKLEEFDDTNTYDLDGDGDADVTPPAGDKYRRRLLVTTIKLRNM